MTLDPQSCRALAVEVVSAAVNDLKAHHKQRDVDFFLSPERSELWCVGAGLDYDATVSRLRAQGHLTAAPVTVKRKPAPVPRPGRSAYQMEMERRVLKVLPLGPDTACTVRQIADYVGVYAAVVRTALDGLRGRGKAECQRVPRRGGTTAMWWRV